MTALRNLCPYPAYKPSGVEWLGDVPEHWEVAALKRVAELNPSKTEAKSSLAADTPVTFLPMAQVGTDGAIDGQMLPASAVWTGFSYFRRNDVLVAKITPCFENGKGACLDSLPTEVGFGSTEFHVLRAKSSVSPQFLYHTTNLVDFRRLGANAMTGAAGQQRVPLEFVANHPLAVPPLPEQTAIVRYLDYVDRRIRRYIQGKERLVALLGKERQAVVSKAVTRGLDSGVPLKSTGVEWLGDVPEHWEVAALKRVAELNPSKTEAKSSLAADTPVTFLPMAQVGTDGAIDGQMLPASAVWTGFSYFRRNDVLVAKITPCFENGKGACLDSLPTEVGFGSTEFHVLRAKSSVSPQFLYHTTNLVDFRSLGANAMTGAAGQQRVPPEFVANYPLAVPPLPEQNAIVAYLGKALAEIDAGIARARRQIELLHEYRTRLVSDLVTGKVDVRKVMPLMQEEPSDRELESVSANHKKGSL